MTVTEMRQAVEMHEANYDFIRAEIDASYADITRAYALVVAARRRLHDATFGQITGCAR